MSEGLGRGSTFTVRLPIVERPPDHRPRTPALEERAAHEVAIPVRAGSALATLGRDVTRSSSS